MGAQGLWYFLVFGFVLAAFAVSYKTYFEAPMNNIAV